VAVWIFGAALVCAGFGITRWEQAEDDVAFSEEEPDRDLALVLLGFAGVGSICGTIVYVTAPEPEPQEPDPHAPDPPPVP
jgi:hypothetical protein